MFKWSCDDKIAIPILLVIIIGSSILLRFLLKNKSEKVKQFPLCIISITLIVLEVAKQIYFGVSGIYTKNTLPIHFCSFIIILIALTQFLPKKVSRWLEAPSVVFTLMVLLLVLVHPKSTIGDTSKTMFTSFPNFHIFYFHALVMWYPVLKLSLTKFDLKAKYCLVIVGCILIYGAYAVPLAYTLGNNYLNILSNVVPIFERFRLAYGQVLYNIVWFLGLIVVCLGVYFLWYGINKLLEKRRDKNA